MIKKYGSVSCDISTNSNGNLILINDLIRLLKRFTNEEEDILNNINNLIEYLENTK